MAFSMRKPRPELWTSNLVSPMMRVPLLAALFAVGANVVFLAVSFVRGPLQDFTPVYAAELAYAQGLDPYDLRTLTGLNREVAFPFLYPPHVLWLLKPLVWLPYPMAAMVHGILTALAAGYVFGGQTRLFGLQLRATLGGALFVLALSSAALQAVASGNVSVLLYAFLTAGLVALGRERPLLFHAVVLVAGLFKFYYLWFLVLPLMIDFRRQLPAALIVVVFTVAVYGASYRLDPLTFEAFIGSSAYLMAQARDYGEGMFGLPMRAIDELAARTPLKLPSAVGYALFAIFAAAIVVFSSRIGNAYRGETDVRRRKTFLALLWLATILTLPRLKVYDAFAAIVPVLVLWEQHLLKWRVSVNIGWVIMLAILVPATFHYNRHIFPLIGEHWIALTMLGCWLCATVVNLGKSPEAGHAASADAETPGSAQPDRATGS